MTRNSSQRSCSLAFASKTPPVSPLACNIHPSSPDFKHKNIEWLTAKRVCNSDSTASTRDVSAFLPETQRCILHVKDEPLKEIRRVFVWLWFLKNAERYLRWCLFAFKGSKLMYFSGLEGSHFLSGRRSRSHSVFFSPTISVCFSVIHSQLVVGSIRAGCLLWHHAQTTEW